MSEVAKKKSAIRPWPQPVSLPGFDAWPAPIILKVWWPVILEPFDLQTPNFSALKDLILFSTVSKDQKASSILKVGFALSKWPHLHRAYVISGCIFFATAVQYFIQRFSLVGMDVAAFLYCITLSWKLLNLLHKLAKQQFYVNVFVDIIVKLYLNCLHVTKTILILCTFYII